MNVHKMCKDGVGIMSQFNFKESTQYSTCVRFKPAVCVLYTVSLDFTVTGLKNVSSKMV